MRPGTRGSGEELMGLFSYYVGYKRAQKKAARQQQREEWEAEEICIHCGYAERQHSDSGECPSYS